MYRFLLRDLFKAYSIVYNPFFDLEKHFFFSTLFLFNPLREDNTVIMTEKKHDVTGTVIKNRAAYHNWLKTPRLKNARSYRDLTSKTPLPIHADKALYKSTKSHKITSKSKFVISHDLKKTIAARTFIFRRARAHTHKIRCNFVNHWEMIAR